MAGLAVTCLATVSLSTAHAETEPGVAILPAVIGVSHLQPTMPMNLTAIGSGQNIQLDFYAIGTNGSNMMGFAEVVDLASISDGFLPDFVEVPLRGRARTTVRSDTTMRYAINPTGFEETGFDVSETYNGRFNLNGRMGQTNVRINGTLNSGVVFSNLTEDSVDFSVSNFDTRAQVRMYGRPQMTQTFSRRTAWDFDLGAKVYDLQDLEATNRSERRFRITGPLFAEYGVLDPEVSATVRRLNARDNPADFRFNTNARGLSRSMMEVQVIPNSSLNLPPDALNPSLRSEFRSTRLFPTRLQSRGGSSQLNVTTENRFTTVAP